MAKPELAKLIAAEVRRLHGLEIPGSKEPQLWHDIYKFIDKGIVSVHLPPFRVVSVILAYTLNPRPNFEFLVALIGSMVAFSGSTGSAAPTSVPIWIS